MVRAQASHWAAAAGGAPEPGLRTPLQPAIALMRRRSGRLPPFAMSRAVAAAERRIAVLPSWCSAAQAALPSQFCSKTAACALSDSGRATISATCCVMLRGRAPCNATLSPAKPSHAYSLTVVFYGHISRSVLV